MASSTARVSFRVAFVLVVLVALFYVGRPLYWKLSATVHDIREKKTTVKEGISQFVLEARRSVGWAAHHDELSDLGAGEEASGTKIPTGLATSRRALRFTESKRIR